MIKSPQALRRWAVHGNRHYIGGDSDSATTSTNQTTYNDNRNVTSNDFRNYSVTDASRQDYSFSNSDSHDMAFTDGRSWSDSHNLSDIGNTWAYDGSSRSWADSHNLSDIGNTWAYDGSSRTTNNSSSNANSWNWSSSNSNSGNTSTSNSSSYNSTVTNTGTDAARIVELQGQMMSHMADEQLGSVRALAQLGADVSNNGRDLAMFSAKNSALASEHMLDITGDIINKLAGASASGAAMSATLAQAGASTAATAAGDKQMRMTLIGAAVLVALVALRK